MNPRRLRLIVAVSKGVQAIKPICSRSRVSTKRRFNGPELWPVDTAGAALYVKRRSAKKHPARIKVLACYAAAASAAGSGAMPPRITAAVC